MNVLVCATGSVAAVTYPKLVRAFSDSIEGEIQGIITDSAKRFIGNWREIQLLYSDELEEYEDNGLWMPHTDEDEWKWNEIGDPILHIDLKDWADVLVIAPLSANTLAKMVAGMSDNLLLSVYRAWPMDKPIVVAPAMNTDMWNHPVTREHLDVLHRRHYKNFYRPSGIIRDDDEGEAFLHIVNPVEKNLACGVTGMGAMAPIEDIVKTVQELEGIDNGKI